MKVLVTGAGGFIGHHLVKRLKADGHWVRAADLKEPDFEPSPADDYMIADLRQFEDCIRVSKGINDVYNLAADMGGIGYISTNHAAVARNNVLINSHMTEASMLANVTRYLYTSSACVYPSFLQHTEDIPPLKETDAIPADPEKGYGWEKLFSEQMAQYYYEESSLDVRIVRFHNIYGPQGAYDGGREKAPAAIMRKVAEAKPGSSIEIWGDGEQTRSFCYVSDCVEGLVRIMDSGYTGPLNLGRDELVTVNELVDITCEIADKELIREHDLSKPQGVRGRNSDNRLLLKTIGWEPQTNLRTGIEQTYAWIWRKLSQKSLAEPPVP